MFRLPFKLYEIMFRLGLNEVQTHLIFEKEKTTDRTDADFLNNF